MRRNTSQCLTSSLPSANMELIKEPPRPDRPQDLRLIASATLMQKNSPLIILPTSFLRSLQRRSVNVNQSSITRLAKWKKVALLNVIILTKAHGRERWRLSFADSGCKDFLVRTRWKIKAVASLTVKRNFKRKRDSADNTLHQFVRISWSTQVNAPMEQDAFSSTQQKTSESDNPTRTWSRTTSDIQLWDVSRRLRELMCFTSTLTQLPPQDWVPSSPFATMQKTNMRMKSLKTTGHH